MANPDEEDILDDVNSADINKKSKDNQSATSQAADVGKRKLLDIAKEKVVDKIVKTKPMQAIIGKFKAIKLVPFLVGFIIIICIIGFIFYFLLMPGYLRGRLESLFSEGIEGLKESLYGTNIQLSGQNLDKEKRIGLLQYISDMGLDVVGYGFAPEVTYSKNDDGKEVISDYRTNLMSVKDEDENAINPNGDLLYYYLMANERAYVRKGNGILGTLFGFDKSKWTGMLDIKGDKGIDGIESSVDRDKQVLTITRNKSLIDSEGLNNLFDEYVYSFPLDGWTGRFGIPVEFSLALHLATMSSGMVQELLTNPDLQTTVTIGLQEAECTLNFRFNIKNDDGSIRELNAPYSDTHGDIDWLKNKIMNGEEITEDDISIEGLYSAYKFLAMNKYQVITNNDKLLQFDDNSTYSSMGLGNISRHLETLSALVGSKDIAVQVGTDFTATSDGKTEFEMGDIEIPVFYRKDDGSATSGRIDVTANSGAYICQYKDNSDEANTTTGKLNAATVLENTVTTTRSNYEKTADTDEYTEYKLISIGLDEEQKNDYSDLYEYVPKGNKYVKNGDISYYRIKGLGNFTGDFSLSDVVYLRQNKDAYDAMFEEIDWFISLTIWANNWDLSSFNYGKQYTSMDKINHFYGSDDETRNLSEVNYYKYLFDNALNSNDPVEVKAKLQYIISQINGDYQTIQNGAVTLDAAQDEIEHILEKLNCKELTQDVVTFLYEQFASTVKENGTVVKYVQPYILSVVKHWFKDVDFSKAYSSTEMPVELQFPSGTVLPDTIEVVSVLSPKKGQALNTQTQQPYVVKGDVVMMDGEKVDRSELNKITNVANDVDGYQWGDGYRATKKIFTQGFYYSYDGSAESSRSIYYQQEIEKLTGGNAYQFRVVGGRIASTYRLADLDLTYDGAISTGESKQLYNKDGIELYYTGTGNRSSDGAKVDFYVIRVNNNALAYLSPVENDYETVKSRVDRINNIWQLAGVQCYRTHLTFDTVLDTANENGDEIANAQVMAATGLSILKNTKTDDAEYIYRDLKEMLIELGYYTEAEFDRLDTDVLDWFIPDYEPAIWPQNEEEDALSFSASLYPIDKPTASEDSEADASTDSNADTNKDASDTKADETENGSDSENNSDNNNSDKDDLTTEEIISDEKELRLRLGLTVDKSLGFEPDLDVIAPGDCVVKAHNEDGIEIQFNGETEPEIAVLDGYRMVIEGINTDNGITMIDDDGNETTISYDEAINNETVIPVGSIIGKTGRLKITVMLMNDKAQYISNIEDYMSPKVEASGAAGVEYSGSLSQEFYYYLGVVLEGMKYTTDEYFTSANGNVSGGGDNSQGYITVGPGLLMDDQKLATYVAKGGTKENNRSLSSKYRKDIILEMYIEYVDGVFKAKVDELLEGSNVSQAQVEALVLSCYQRGTGSNDLRSIISAIKAGKSADEIKNMWVTRYNPGDPSSYPGVYARRYSEWYLFKYGEYIQPYSNSHSLSGGSDTPYDFGSETPFEDFLNGK